MFKKTLTATIVSLSLFASPAFATKSIFRADDYNWMKDEKGYALYFKYIDMFKVYTSFSNTVYSDAKVGIFDAGVYDDHEDFYIYSPDENLGEGKYKFHGSIVSSIIAGHAGNSLGARGIVQLNKGLYYHYSSSPNKYEKYARDQADSLDDFLSAGNFDIVNMSIPLSVYSGSQVVSDFSREDYKKHIKWIGYIREVMKRYPKTLFVISAGNSFTNATQDNGAIHYIWDNSSNSAKSLPLDNVIVVGSVNISSNSYVYAEVTEETKYSDYGESVDVYTPAYVVGATTVENGISKYEANNLGTSFSAPMVTAVAALLYSSSSMKGNPRNMKHAILEASNIKKTDNLKHVGSKPLLNAYYSIKYALNE